jgi:hypothetical protein
MTLKLEMQGEHSCLRGRHLQLLADRQRATPAQARTWSRRGYRTCGRAVTLVAAIKYRFVKVISPHSQARSLLTNAFGVVTTAATNE